METYEVRDNLNPGAMPLGTAIRSRHRSPEAARAAIEREARRFRRSPHSTAGSYLPRTIVRLNADGSESLV